MRFGVSRFLSVFRSKWISAIPVSSGTMSRLLLYCGLPADISKADWPFVPVFLLPEENPFLLFALSAWLPETPVPAIPVPGRQISAPVPAVPWLF